MRSGVAWFAVGAVLAAIGLVLQVLVALGRWEGPRPWLRKGSTAENTVAVVAYAAAFLFCIVGVSRGW